MEDTEGSVMMEGFEDVSSSDTTSENINNSEGESQDEGSAGEIQPDTSVQDDSQSPTLTDKGTKLDPNPESAVHQELANARREAEEYRQFMSDPQSVKRYLEELERDAGNITGENRQEIQERAVDENVVTDPSKIVTPEDFQSYVKFLTNDVQKAKQDLLNERNSIREQNQESAVNSRLVNEIDSLQNKYSFLKDKNDDGTLNPNFDKELEKEIADQFEELDKDPRTGKYLGKVSITAIAERAIRIRKLGEATGNKNAQTNVVDKRHGAIRTGSGGSSSSDESKMTSTQLIASRMANARRR